MNDDQSKDTVSTSDLLDLIQADVNAENNHGNKFTSKTSNTVSNNGIRSNRYNSNGVSSRRKESFNRVRLTPHSSAQTRSVLSDDSDTLFAEDDTVTDFLDSFSTTSGISTINQRSTQSQSTNSSSGSNTITRQRMPLDGGYGGMFAPGTGTKAYSASRMQVHSNQERSDLIHQNDDHSDGVSALTSLRGDDDHTGTTGYTLTSRIFSVINGSSKRKPNNPYSVSGNGSTTHTVSSSTSKVDTSFIAKLAVFYLNMPFRLRYFLQLFSIIGVLMIASLNYFIAMEHVPMDGGDSHLSPLEKKMFVGGGAASVRIPRLRVRNPLHFLHADYNQNILMERASEKLEQSSRYKGKAGDQTPFSQGWKSMPRQIFNDFATGLSDDSKTIQHTKAKNNNTNRRLPPKGTVAYVLPLTNCAPPRNNAKNFFPYSPNQPKDDDSFQDFAVMLRAMIHAQSYQNLSSGSKYDYKMHAIIHPRAKSCGGTDRSVLLQNLGYHVSVQSSPVGIHQLKQFDAAKEILGELNDASDRLPDFARLHAYELEEYDAVIMVDFDTLVLGSIDEALDLVVGDKNNMSSGGSSSVDAVFSWEHVPLMSHPEAMASVINLSFFVLRPSKETYGMLITALKNAPFSASRGWGLTGRGSFPGWMTTQGFLTYFYDEVRNGAKVEMNQCVFGNTAESSTSQLITNGGTVDCNSSPDSSNQCNDCSKTALDEVRVADLSYCLAPWECGGESSSADNLMSGLCRQYHKKWFGGRLQMEDVHPQLQKTIGKLCIDGQYQPMIVAEH